MPKMSFSPPDFSFHSFPWSVSGFARESVLTTIVSFVNLWSNHGSRLIWPQMYELYQLRLIEPIDVFWELRRYSGIQIQCSVPDANCANVFFLPTRIHCDIDETQAATKPVPKKATFGRVVIFFITLRLFSFYHLASCIAVESFIACCCMPASVCRCIGSSLVPPPVWACFWWRPKTRSLPWNAITVRTHIQEFQLSHEGVSEVSKQSERNEQTNEHSERTNVASDRVALSKRDRLWLETPP